MPTPSPAYDPSTTPSKYDAVQVLPREDPPLTAEPRGEAFWGDDGMTYESPADWPAYDGGANATKTRPDPATEEGA